MTSMLPEALTEGVASVTEGVTDMADAFVAQSAKTTGMVADTLDAVFATHDEPHDERHNDNDEDDDDIVVSTKLQTGPMLPKTALNFFSTDGKSYEEIRAQEIDEAQLYRSLGVFSIDHPVRAFCVSLLKYKYGSPQPPHPRPSVRQSSSLVSLSVCERSSHPTQPHSHAPPCTDALCASPRQSARRWWSTIVTFAVFLNCVCLAVRQPLQPAVRPCLIPQTHRQLAGSRSLCRSVSLPQPRLRRVKPPGKTAVITTPPVPVGVFIGKSGRVRRQRIACT